MIRSTQTKPIQSTTFAQPFYNRGGLVRFGNSSRFEACQQQDACNIPAMGLQGVQLIGGAAFEVSPLDPRSKSRYLEALSGDANFDREAQT